VAACPLIVCTWRSEWRNFPKSLVGTMGQTECRQFPLGKEGRRWVPQVRLERLNVIRLGTFRALNHVELDLLVLLQ
jgi:hypothetical protein